MPGISVTDLGSDLYLIDARMHDETERLACYLFDTPERVLIECGPSASIHHLYDALDELGIDDLGVLAVTHIHLDHAGGAGHFAARFPGARIAVHDSGARHLVDPTRLWNSAERIWGPDGMRTLWGPMEPIDPDRLLVLDDGDRIPLGRGRHLEALHTPGHARHHIVYTDDESGGAFVGDAVGVAFPHGHLVQPVTPPPDFDPEQVATDLRALAVRSPRFLGFAHFGPDRDPQASLAAAEQRLWSWVRWVESAVASGDESNLHASLRSWVLEGYRADGIPEADIAHYDRTTFWPMQTAGIIRWLEHRS